MLQHPTLFLSHGAPNLTLKPSPVREFLSQLGQQLPKPQAILVISAHWVKPQSTVSLATQPKTIHDFSGFEPELYEVQYPAPGAPDVARQVKQCLQTAGIEVHTASDRGLDHGAWVPLSLMYPQAQIPVVQLSVGAADPEFHLRMGKALQPLRRQGVLIIGSGSATHNLKAFRDQGWDAPPLDWAIAFDDWLREKLIGGAIAELLNYRQQAPQAVRNHPTEEHFLPLFVALGAGGQSVDCLHRSFTYGCLSMAAYAFS